MNGYYIHLKNSTLKVALYDESGQTQFAQELLLPTAVSNSKIIDPKEFAEEFKKMLSLHFGHDLPKLPMFFVLEPELTKLFLLTTQKQQTSESQNVDDLSDTTIKEQLAKKLGDEPLEDFYYDLYKLAPFTYQFLGIKKSVLDPFLETQKHIGLEIRGVFPIALALAKTNTDVSSIFVFPDEKETCIIFNELSGISLAEKLNDNIPLSKLKKIFWAHSIYGNKVVEPKIYSYKKYEHLSQTEENVRFLDEEYKLEPNFEDVSLIIELLRQNKINFFSQHNLLTIFVSKEDAPQKFAVKKLAGALVLILIISIVISQIIVNGNFSSQIKTSNQSQQVLSENKEQQNTPQQTTDNNQNNSQATPSPEVKQIKRSDLKIKVLNGNGIPGSAGKMKAYLEGFGYKVLDPGNADNIDYQKTLVKIPKDLLNYKDLLVNDLKTNYAVEVMEIEDKFLDYDILIVVGKS